MTTSTFNSIAADAVAASAFWAGQSGSNISVNLNSGAMQTIVASGDGANVFNSTGDFIINSGSKLVLTGGVGDFFVINVSDEQLFSIQSNSIIQLGGDITPSEVLFNVLGNISSSGPDDALIGGGSIFQGTLLAPGRKVEVTQNHFFSFVSSGFPDDDGGTNAPSTTIISAAAIAEKEANDSSFGGLFGQIVAGGTINFTESDISYFPFMARPGVIPEPGSWAIWTIMSLASAGMVWSRRARQCVKFG